jgi:Mn-containing catalase
MWNYEKRLEFPVNITTPNAKLAQVIISQYGGPDGEMGASMRYLSQRYAMPYREVSSILTDIGTEELAHLEMVATIVHQLTKNLSMEEIENSGFANYYVDHTLGIWPQAASGFPFTGAQFQSVGDPITDLTEDMAADEAPVLIQQLELPVNNDRRQVCSMHLVFTAPDFNMVDQRTNHDSIKFFDFLVLLQDFLHKFASFLLLYEKLQPIAHIF